MVWWIVFSVTRIVPTYSAYKWFAKLVWAFLLMMLFKLGIRGHSTWGLSRARWIFPVPSNFLIGPGIHFKTMFYCLSYMFVMGARCCQICQFYFDFRVRAANLLATRKIGASLQVASFLLATSTKWNKLSQRKLTLNELEIWSTCISNNNSLDYEYIEHTYKKLVSSLP